MSYDEILRRTVPEPDLSFRPSREEQALSQHRFGEATEHRPHRLTPTEQELLERVAAALIADPSLDLSGVEVAVDRRRVILRGTTAGPATRIRIEEIVAAQDGVDRVYNELVLRSRRA